MPVLCCKNSLYFNMLRILHIAMILSVLFFAKSQAQTVNETFAKAEHFLDKGEQSLAEKHFRRALYFTPDNEKSDLWYKAARASDRNKAYGLTEAYSDSSLKYLSLTDTSKYAAVLLLKSKALLMQHRNRQALSLLDSNAEILNLKNDSIVAFYRGIALLEIGEPEAAQIAFEQFLGSGVEANKKQLEALFSKPDWFHKPHPEIAFRLSQILPGSGQMYAGYPKEALNSFLLNAGLFILLYDLSVNYSWYNGLLSVYPWFERYYLSGLQKASELAREKRQLKRQQVISEIIRMAETE
jgi:hypothetical protein